MLLEVQQRPLSFVNAFQGSITENDLKFGIFMMVLDIFLYFLVGFLYQRFWDNEYKFYEVPTKDMDSDIGASLQNVTKSYGAKKSAISNVSVTFRRDYITCLLGRNGAGKSTIIKLLTGEIEPTEGVVNLPQNLDRGTGRITKERVGLCPQSDVMIPNLTPKEHLQLYAAIKLNNSNSPEVGRIMQDLEFGKYEHFRCEHLSGGFKRRLNIGIAFLGKH